MCDLCDRYVFMYLCAVCCVGGRSSVLSAICYMGAVGYVWYVCDMCLTYVICMCL